MMNTNKSPAVESFLDVGGLSFNVLQTPLDLNDDLNGDLNLHYPGWLYIIMMIVTII